MHRQQEIRPDTLRLIQRQKEISQMTTLRELRKLASSIGIKKYSRLTKSQLEAEISKLNAATAKITTSASDNDSAPASQPANVATPHSNTADSAKSLLSPDYKERPICYISRV